MSDLFLYLWWSRPSQILIFNILQSNKITLLSTIQKENYLCGQQIIVLDMGGLSAHNNCMTVKFPAIQVLIPRAGVIFFKSKQLYIATYLNYQTILNL